MQKTSSNTTLDTMLVLAAIVIIVAGMRVASPILVPVLLAIFIAIISAPPLIWLENRGLPTFLALLVVILGILGFGLVLVSLVGTSLNEFQTQIPFYEQRLDHLFQTVNSFASKHGIDLQISDIASAINPESVARTVGNVVNEVGSLVANAFLIFLIVIFILFELSTLPGKLESIFANSAASIHQLSKLKSSVQRYVVIKSITSLATGILVWILLTVLDVDFAVLWATLALFLNFVPNIGSIIAAVPAILVALLQIGAPTAAWTAVGYVVINNVIGNIVEPRLAGRQLGLSPLVVFLSLVFWGWILGPVGMFLSVPLTMMVRLIAEISENTRWLAVLLSDQARSTEQ